MDGASLFELHSGLGAEITSTICITSTSTATTEPAMSRWTMYSEPTLKVCYYLQMSSNSLQYFVPFKPEKGDISKIWRGDKGVGEEGNETSVHEAANEQKIKKKK